MKNTELKEKIKTVMIDHLKSIGYPNITNEQIMNELKPMWIKLEEANLIQSGMSFQEFTLHAQQQFMIADMINHFGGRFQ